MKSVKKIKLERVIDIIFFMGLIMIIIIASIHVEKKNYYVSFISIISLGIYLIGLFVNLIYKTTKIKIEKWKKITIYIIYTLDIIYIIYSIIIKSFHWLPYVFAFNFLLVLIEFKKRDKPIES